MKDRYFYKKALAVFFIFLAAFSLRLLPLNHVFSGGTVYFFDGDPYLHLRKALLNIRNFPSPVTFDPYEGFPQGTGVISPPLLECLLALISFVIGGGNPSSKTVETVAALIPPVIGGFTAVAVFFFARRLFGRETAFLSSALISIMPAHLHYTVAGRPDNEMMEPLMAVLLFMSYLKFMGKEAGPKSLGWMFLTSVAALFSLLFWRGATVFIILVFLGIFTDTTIGIIRGSLSLRKSIEGGGVFLLLSVYISVLCGLDIWGGMNTFSFNIISWFHVLLSGAIGIGLFSYGLAGALSIKRRWRPGLFFASFVSVLLLAFASSVYFFPLLSKNISGGLGIVGLGGVDPWIESVSEFMPYLSAGGLNITGLIRQFGWVFFIAPLICLYIAYKKRWAMGRELVFFMMSVALLFSLTLLRRRFEHIAALFIAVLGGYLIYEFYGFLKGKKGKAAAWAAASMLSLALFYPYVLNAYDLTKRHPGFSIKGYIEDAMLWMRHNTPLKSDPYDLTVLPEYSVMARWDFGGWILYVAQRPAVATLYGSETFGLKESASFFLAPDEASANEVMEKTKARYVIVTQVIGDLSTYAKITGQRGDDFARLIYSTKRQRKLWRPGPRYYGLVSTGLLMSDGIGAKAGAFFFKGVDHYRLLYESQESLTLMGFPRDVKKLKIFEYLPGASLLVRVKRGAVVTVTAKVRTNRGRLFDFVKKGTAGPDGKTTFILPYSISEGEAMTGLITPYTVSASGRSVTLSLSEEDVRGGKKIEINL